MLDLVDLWLPIVVSTVVVFIASSIAWMVLPHHKADMKAAPDQEAVDKALGELNLEPGLYYFPNCQDKAAMKTEAFKERWKRGPWGMLNLARNQPNFGLCMSVIFVEFLVITVLVAYVASRSLGAGAAYLDVFQIVGAAAILGHVFGCIGGDVFQLKPARFIMTNAIDSVAYALLTAGIFGWLWPAADVAVNGAPTIGAP